MGTPDPENLLFLEFSVLRGGLRPWSRKGPDHGVGVDPETVKDTIASCRKILSPVARQAPTKALRAFPGVQEAPGRGSLRPQKREEKKRGLSQTGSLPPYRKQEVLTKTAKMTNRHSIHKNKGFAPQTPENDENDENGGCHARKDPVC